MTQINYCEQNKVPTRVKNKHQDKKKLSILFCSVDLQQIFFNNCFKNLHLKYFVLMKNVKLKFPQTILVKICKFDLLNKLDINCIYLHSYMFKLFDKNLKLFIKTH